MSRVLVVFGLLDIGVVVLAYRQVLSLLTTFSSGYPWTWISYTTLYLTLVASGLLLIRRRELGLWMTYGQLPLKLLTHIFSFSFLYLIVDDYQSEKELSWVMVTLEFARVGLTIWIHKTHFQRVT